MAPRILGGIDTCVRALLFAIVVAMVAVVFAEVFCRYALNASIPWADEASRLAFVWTVFLGLSVAARARAHIGVPLLVDALPDRVRTVLGRVVLLACAGLSGIVAWQAMVVGLDQWDEAMMSMRLSSGWFNVPVAVGMLLAGLHFLAAAAGAAAGPAVAVRAE